MRVKHNPNYLRTGNLMFDLIASLTVSGTEVTIKSTKGNEESFAAVISRVLDAAPITPAPLPATSRKHISVLQIYEEYCQRSGITERTRQASVTIKNYIEELFGDCFMDGVTRDQAFAVKNRIPNLLSTKVFAGGKRKKISPVRASQLLAAISAFFVWAVSQGYADVNPFNGLKLSVETTTEKVECFSAEDLKKLFEGEKFQSFVSSLGYRYWLCAIGLYSGMRLAEIAQLEVSDVVKDKSGRYFFNITKKTSVEGHKKKLKTDHSERLMPVSSKLIELGFEKYLETVKSEGSKFLFPDVPLEKDGTTRINYFSLAFSVYRREALQNETRQTFHSLRHNAISCLKHKKFQLSDIQQFCGHAYGNITFDIYGEPAGAETMIELAEAVSYDVKFPAWEDRLEWKRQRRKGMVENKKVLAG